MDLDTQKRGMVDVLQRHFQPTLDMLAQVIECCPEELWVESKAGSPYWQQIYHTTFFIDFWLRHEYRQGVEFRSMIFDKELEVELDQPSCEQLSRVELTEYLDKIRQKMEQFFANLDDEKLLQPIMPGSRFTYADAILCQIRHVQYHEAQCGTILGENRIEGISWKGYNEN